jgi:PAT family beta-lactamase induction signal transducer AmpG
MGRRRPWVIASQICAFLASLGLLFVGNPPTKYIKTLVVAFFIHSIFASIQDASVDAQAITTIPLNERGRLNGFMRAGFLVGSAMGAAGLSWVLRNRSYLAAASINSIALFIFTLITFFIKEKSDDKLFPCSKNKINSKNQKYQQEKNYSILKLFKELFKGLLAAQSLRLFIPILIVYASQAAFIRAYNSKLNLNKCFVFHSLFF